jgi:hypothetical protein
MEIIALLIAQAAITTAGFAYFWRRQRAADTEIARLRADLAALESAQFGLRQKRKAVAARATDHNVITLPPKPVASERRDEQPAKAHESADLIQGVTLAAIAGAPALGFAFGVDAAFLAAGGLAVAAAMMALALRPHWSVAAWASVITGAGWAVIGHFLGAEHATLAFALALAGVAGLAFARVSALAPGAALAFAMAAVALLGSANLGMVGPYGVAFSMLVAAGAIVGAFSVRLEPMHFGAFAAALAGLFVLSGQSQAAIWFTPAAAWTGALFFAIAAVRVPQAGARAAGFAGTGALGPLLAVGALYSAQHGLADPRMAGLAFVIVALLLSGLIALAAQRRSLETLRLAHWILAVSALIALSFGVVLALAPPLAAPTFAALACGLAYAGVRWKQAIWRGLAIVLAILGLFEAAVATAMLLAETPGWNPWIIVSFGVALTGALAFLAARICAQHGHIVGARCLEGVAFLLAAITASAVLRLMFSSGAMLLTPVGFVEAGAHISVWLTLSLLIAMRSNSRFRSAFATVIAAFALGAALLAALLWLTPFWTARQIGPSHAPLGFLAPATLAWVHWVFWRARGSNLRTRAAFAAGAVLSASYVMLELLQRDGIPTWVTAILCGGATALALGVNFAPGITADDAPIAKRPRRRRRTA